MSHIVEQSWSLPEADTVFNFHFRLDLDPGSDAFWVDVECLGETPETQRVTLDPAGSTPISLAFQSGYGLRGTMRVVGGGDRRAPTAGVKAVLHYGLQDRPPVRHFQGFIFHEARANARPDAPGSPSNSPPEPDVGEPQP